ncbi:MAG: hypothetical protein H7Y07_11520 [Pyrinomonadaceae bacterium]|nr:hypothetical protein [Sphingobacteriaceae bacterium]
MKKYLLFLIPSLLLYACGVKEQAEQLQALEKCTYEIASADSVYIAGTDINTLLTPEGLNLLQTPKLAFSYLQQKMPVKAVLNLKITNNGTEEAGINQFEYKVMIKETQLLSGFINQKISVSANGGTSIVPVKVDRDIYALISDAGNQQAISNFLNTNSEKNVVIIFKIKPAFIIGTEVIQYPDYISITREVKNTTLLAYLKKNN